MLNAVTSVSKVIVIFLQLILFANQNRRQKVFNRGLCVSTGGLDILKIDKNSTDLLCFMFQFGGAWRFVWGG